MSQNITTSAEVALKRVWLSRGKPRGAFSLLHDQMEDAITRDNNSLDQASEQRDGCRCVLIWQICPLLQDKQIAKRGITGPARHVQSVHSSYQSPRNSCCLMTQSTVRPIPPSSPSADPSKCWIFVSDPLNSDSKHSKHDTTPSSPLSTEH